jgi:uncharacterized membrane protein HdeD (DUF308 family)
VLLGAVCAILGIIGMVDLGMAYALTVYSVVLFGILFVISGIAQFFSGLVVRPLARALLQFACGILYVLAGVFAITEPKLAAGIYTLLLAISLIVSGALRIVLAFLYRRVMNWLGLVLGGVFTMLVGGAILAQWPSDSAWVIGVFFAVELLFQGVAWISLGLNLRSAARAERAGPD